MMRIMNEDIAIGFNDYLCELCIDMDAKKIVSITVLDEVIEEEFDIYLKPGTLIRNNQYDVNYKEVLRALFETVNEDGDRVIVVE